MAKNMQTNILLGGKVLPSLNNAFALANKRMLQVNKTAGVFTRATGTMRTAFSTASRFIGLDSLIMGAGFAYVGQKGLMLASDLKEVQNVVDVTFGESASIIDAWAKSASKSYGLSELQAKKFTGSMGAMLKSSGLSSELFLEMSKNLTGLAGDMASFYNLDIDDAFEKISSGISGQVKPLRDLGINMTVANLEAFALSKGIKTAWDKMGQANQTAIRYAYLMKVSKDSQGDFTRTQGEFANQLRLVQNNFNRVISTVAIKFLPTANKAVTWANKFMDSLDIDALAMRFEKAGGKVASTFGTIYKAGKWTYDLFADNWPLVEPILWGLGSALIFNRIAMAALNKETVLGMVVTTLSKAWQGAAFALEWMRAGLSLTTLAQWSLNAAMSANPIGVIVVGIGILGTALYALYKNWDKITKFFIDSWNKVKSVFSGPIKAPDPRGSRAMSGNPKMARHATGGFSDRAAIFGEAGLEAAIPIKPGNSRSIGLLNRTARMLGVSNSGSPNITIYQTINAQNGDAKEIADESTRQITNVFDEYFGERRRLSFG